MYPIKGKYKCSLFEAVNFRCYFYFKLLWCFLCIFSFLIFFLDLLQDQFPVKLDFIYQITPFTFKLTQTNEMVHASHALDY